MKDGWYWYRSDDLAARMLCGTRRGWEMVEIVNVKCGPCVRGHNLGNGYNLPIAEMPGRYVGPLEEPELTEEDPE